MSLPTLCCPGKQLALLNTNSAVRTCGFDFSGNIIMFSTDKQMGYQCFLNFFDLRDPQQIGTYYILPLVKEGETSICFQLSVALVNLEFVDC